MLDCQPSGGTSFELCCFLGVTGIAEPPSAEELDSFKYSDLQNLVKGWASG